MPTFGCLLQAEILGQDESLAIREGDVRTLVYRDENESKGLLSLGLGVERWKDIRTLHTL